MNKRLSIVCVLLVACISVATGMLCWNLSVSSREGVANGESPEVQVVSQIVWPGRSRLKMIERLCSTDIQERFIRILNGGNDICGLDQNIAVCFIEGLLPLEQLKDFMDTPIPDISCDRVSVAMEKARILSELGIKPAADTLTILTNAIEEEKARSLAKMWLAEGKYTQEDLEVLVTEIIVSAAHALGCAGTEDSGALEATYYRYVSAPLDVHIETRRAGVAWGMQLRDAVVDHGLSRVLVELRRGPPYSFMSVYFDRYPY